MVHAKTNRVDKGASLPAIIEPFVISAFVLLFLQQVIASRFHRDIRQFSVNLNTLGYPCNLT
jgi:hypothetical protein